MVWENQRYALPLLCWLFVLVNHCLFTFQNDLVCKCMETKCTILYGCTDCFLSIRYLFLVHENLWPSKTFFGCKSLVAVLSIITTLCMFILARHIKNTVVLLV